LRKRKERRKGGINEGWERERGRWIVGEREGKGGRGRVKKRRICSTNLRDRRLWL